MGREILKHFIQVKSSDLLVVYMVYGSISETEHRVLLVSEENIEKVKNRLVKTFFVHIYSIQMKNSNAEVNDEHKVVSRNEDQTKLTPTNKTQSLMDRFVFKLAVVRQEKKHIDEDETEVTKTKTQMSMRKYVYRKQALKEEAWHEKLKIEFDNLEKTPQNMCPQDNKEEKFFDTNIGDDWMNDDEGDKILCQVGEDYVDKSMYKNEVANNNKKQGCSNYWSQLKEEFDRLESSVEFDDEGDQMILEVSLVDESKDVPKDEQFFDGEISCEIEMPGPINVIEVDAVDSSSENYDNLN